MYLQTNKASYLNDKRRSFTGSSSNRVHVHGANVYSLGSLFLCLNWLEVNHLYKGKRDAKGKWLGVVCIFEITENIQIMIEIWSIIEEELGARGGGERSKQNEK